MNGVYFYLSSSNDGSDTADDDAIIIGGQSSSTQSTVAEGTTVDTSQTQQSAADGGLNLIGMLLMWGALFGALYFFMIRPQRKREKETQEMQSSIRSGDNVVTSSGLYGKVVDVGEDCFVVEFGTNRGIRVPVRKTDILGIKTPNINPSTREIASSEKDK